MARELAKKNIRVNRISPGFLETDFNREAREKNLETWNKRIAKVPLGGRPGTPEDIAGAALYLASDAASYVTGIDILVYGGYFNLVEEPMKNLAPQITCQRLLIEGYYTIEVDEKTITEYMHSIASQMELRTYGEPTIFSPGGEGKEENQGYDAFIPLIDSGISLYVWSAEKFLSAVIYTCKNFIEKKAYEFTKKFFGMDDKIEFLDF